MVIDVPGEVLVQRLQELAKLWQKYMDIFTYSMQHEIDEEKQKEFLNLQLEITRRAQFLSSAIPNSLFDLWKDMKKLLVQTPTLEILKNEVPIRISNFRSLWHDTSIALNQKQGQLRTLLEERETGKVKKGGRR